MSGDEKKTASLVDGVREPVEGDCNRIFITEDGIAHRCWLEPGHGGSCRCPMGEVASL
jgi:molybdenum cofactor biosynthesis enzyme MoaA